MFVEEEANLSKEKPTTRYARFQKPLIRPSAAFFPQGRRDLKSSFVRANQTKKLLAPFGERSSLRRQARVRGPQMEGHAPSWPKMSLQSKLQQRTKIKSPVRQPGEGGLKLEGHALSWPRTVLLQTSPGVRDCVLQNDRTRKTGFFLRTRQSGSLQRTNAEIGRERPGPLGGRDGACPSNGRDKARPSKTGGPRSVVPENNDDSASVENVNAKNESEAVGGRTVGRGNPRFFGGRDGARPSKILEGHAPSWPLRFLAGGQFKKTCPVAATLVNFWRKTDEFPDTLENILELKETS